MTEYKNTKQDNSFALDLFTGNFNPSDFIQNLLVNISTANGKDDQFNPTPYIRSLETVADDLLRAKRKIQAKIEDQEDSAK